MNEGWRDGRLAEFVGVIRRGIEPEGCAVYSFRGLGRFTASYEDREYEVTITPVPTDGSREPFDQAAFDRQVEEYGRQFPTDVDTIAAAANLIRRYGHKIVPEGVEEDKALADQVQEFAEWLGRGIAR